MDKEHIINKIKELKRLVLPDGKLYLFGSQAKGTANDESDWDLLILINKEYIESSDFERYAYPFVDLGWELGEYFSPKLYSFSEWRKRIMTPFYKNVISEGVEL